MVPGIAISGIIALGNRSMRNVITVAGIMLAVTVVTASSQAAESFDGLWARPKKIAATRKAPTARRSSI